MEIPPVYIQTESGRNRLTIAKKRITIKMRDDVSEEERMHLVLFARMIAQRTLEIYGRTMRGCFSHDLQSIEMMNTNRSRYCLYCWDELEPEGFSNDMVGSAAMTSRATKKKAYGVGGYSGGVYSGGGYSGHGAGSAFNEEYWADYID